MTTTTTEAATDATMNATMSAPVPTITGATAAVPPAQRIDLSAEATAAPWEVAVAILIALAALAYLLRSWGLLGRRKQPACATCGSGCGCSAAPGFGGTPCTDAACADTKACADTERREA
ncbi:hypothetical protein A33M_3598 [Rhodovulum sp. PH10]|uniref:hypothetical protein n=1 Tax=Rhodovulum sp. PH10 TaxID=1187851 RepID=UPI00027C2D1A|nr:hypothetical protein [Rhodovulum sp. PH10]EJW11064.1 hypothetical protein A33M_3598 [Rhodovulum sp. PH10]